MSTKRLDQLEVESRLFARGLQLLEAYQNSRSRGLIKCRKCNYEWRVKISCVLHAGGCPKCAGNQMPLDSDVVNERFRTRNLLALEPYKNTETKILIRCIKQGCGYEWKTKPGNIFNGKGCPKCAGGHISLSQEEAAEKFMSLKLELLSEYKYSNEKVLARCTVCSHTWSPWASAVFKGHGCRQCSVKRISTAQRLSQSEVESRYQARGFLLLDSYTGNKKKVLTKCQTCSHEWKTAPACIICTGTGCPKCATPGFRWDKPGILYYVRVQNPFGNPVYKIGITNRTLKERFRQEFARITVIETWHFSSGAEAFEMEQDILNDHDAHRYEGPDILKSNGNDELFTLDVLGLDKGAGQLELVA